MGGLELEGGTMGGTVGRTDYMGCIHVVWAVGQAMDQLEPQVLQP